jgi:hypothetical protein
VREDIRQGREPFGKIMAAVDWLRPDETLLLIVSFEPLPLYGVMAGKGFTYRASQTPTGDWNVFFRREAERPT